MEIMQTLLVCFPQSARLVFPSRVSANVEKRRRSSRSISLRTSIFNSRAIFHRRPSALLPDPDTLSRSCVCR